MEMLVRLVTAAKWDRDLLLHGARSHAGDDRRIPPPETARSNAVAISELLLGCHLCNNIKTSRRQFHMLREDCDKYGLIEP